MPASPTPELDALIAAHPGLVDRIFDYFIQLRPDLANRPEVDEARSLMRAKRLEQRVRDVLALYNGRNPTAIARKLGIGRTTVYRILKQAGYPRPQRSSHQSMEMERQSREDRPARTRTTTKD